VTRQPRNPHSPARGVTGSESEIVRETLAVTAVVKRYLAAVTARNEPEAASFTCGKRNGGLLWIGAVGRPITLLGVTTISIASDFSIATVKIQVEGRPPSPLVLNKDGDTWRVVS
jgi:hypothetical protein